MAEMNLWRELVEEDLQISLYKPTAAETQAAISGLSEGQCGEKISEIVRRIFTEIQSGERKIERLQNQAEKLRIWADLYEDEVRARQEALNLWTARRIELEAMPWAHGPDWPSQTLQWATEEGLNPEVVPPLGLQPSSSQAFRLESKGRAKGHSKGSQLSAGSQPGLRGSQPSSITRLCLRV